MAKVGRKRSGAFETSWGETLHHWRKPDKSNYIIPIGKDRPRYSLSDERLAVMKAKRWDANQTDGPAALHRKEVQSLSDAEYQTWISQGRTRELPETERLDDAIFSAINSERERIRTLILSDPKQASVELRIPHLADYPAEVVKPELTLGELGEVYIRKKRNKKGMPLNGKYKKNLRSWWTEFLALTGNPRYAKELTKPVIAAYYDDIMDRLPDNSPAYVNSRFTAVKAILQYGVDKTDDSGNYRAALDDCATLKRIPTAAKPDPISVEHFQALLAKAGVRERAVLLLGLNCAMHNGEVAASKKAELDLDARTFSADRNKTGVPRVAKLWKRTVDAIRQYQQAHPHHSEYLFVSRTGKHLSGESIRQLFVTLRRQAKVPEKVTFEGLRDGAYKRAFRVNPIYARWIGGHAAWTNQPTESKDITNKYVERDPEDPNVIACCEAVETHYFPPETKKRKK